MQGSQACRAAGTLINALAGPGTRPQAAHLARRVPAEHLAHPLVDLHHLWVQLRGDQLLPVPAPRQAAAAAAAARGSGRSREGCSPASRSGAPAAGGERRGNVQNDKVENCRQSSDKNRDGLGRMCGAGTGGGAAGPPRRRAALAPIPAGLCCRSPPLRLGGHCPGAASAVHKDCSRTHQHAACSRTAAPGGGWAAAQQHAAALVRILSHSPAPEKTAFKHPHAATPATAQHPHLGISVTPCSFCFSRMRSSTRSASVRCW